MRRPSDPGAGGEPPADPGAGGDPAADPGRRLGNQAGVAMLHDLLSNTLDPGYAAAARRKAAGHHPSRPVRHGTGVAFTVAALIIGLILGLGVEQAIRSAPASQRTKQQLRGDIDARSRTTDRLSRSDQKLRSDVDAARGKALAGSKAGRGVATRVRAQELLSGLTPATGPGLIVTAADGAAPSGGTASAGPGGVDLSRVQDRDLQSLVNAIWAAGAEAVSVGGQRLTPTSTIRSAGGAILVNFRPIAGPYVIRAVGDPTTMLRSFQGSTAVANFQVLIKQYQMRLESQTTKNQTLPAAEQPAQPYAKPASATPVPSAS